MLIRSIKSRELYLLKDFLYEAIFQKDENNLIPKEIVNEAELKIYYDDFGKKR